jgi:hypothetical protein
MSPTNGHANDPANGSVNAVQQFAPSPSDTCIPPALTPTGTKIKELIANLEVPFHPSVLFSPMTSFTQCPETSFTLPRVRSTQGGSEKDGMEDDGCSRAEGSVCGGGQTENAAF